MLDVKGSTPLSVRPGDEQFHELLSAVFFDVDAPITELGGEIYEFAGDAVIASWYLGKGNQEQQSYRGSIRCGRRGAPALRMVSAQIR